MRAHLTNAPAMKFSAIPDAFRNGVLPFDSGRSTAAKKINNMLLKKYYHTHRIHTLRRSSPFPWSSRSIFLFLH